MNDDPRVEAAAEAIYDAKFVAPRREPRYETLMVQCRVEAAAALRASDAVKPPCETCGGDGRGWPKRCLRHDATVEREDAHYAEWSTGRWLWFHNDCGDSLTTGPLCESCGGSGEAPSLLDEAMDALAVIGVWDCHGRYEDGFADVREFARNRLAHLCIEDTPKETEGT